MSWSQGDRDSSGELQVDFIWGNMPMQPSSRGTDREEGKTFADQGTPWNDLWAASEDADGSGPGQGRTFPLDTAVADHVIDFGWWNNYPGPQTYNGWD